MINERIHGYLEKHHIAYQRIPHEPTFTAQHTAQAAHIKGRRLAKSVIVTIEGELAMLVLHADERVSLSRLKESLGARSVEFAHEEEFAQRFPDCEPGALPPFGELYGMPVYVSRSLAEQQEMICSAGSHTDLIKLPYEDYVKLACPRRGDFVM
jgi:Ala-tRNA(Pro) deacylase